MGRGEADGAVEVLGGNAVSDPIKSAALSLELLHRLELMQRVMGDRWPQVSSEWRVLINKSMARLNKPLMETALILAQRLDAAGHNPTMMLAVATEMALENKRKP